MLRVLTAGESHGPELIAVMEGLPSGVPVSRTAIQADLERRKLGYGRGSRMKFEQDELHDLRRRPSRRDARRAPSHCASGTPSGPKWIRGDERRAVELTDKSRGRSARSDVAAPGTPTSSACRSTTSTRRDPILERASARETAARVALGALARSFRRSSASDWSATRCRSVRCACPTDAALPPRMTWTPSTPIRSAASTPDLRAHGRRGGCRDARTATRSAASSRCSRTVCRPGSAPTCTGTACSTRVSHRHS